MKPHQRNQAQRKSRGQSAADDPDRPVFFYMPNEPPYGLFCQWYPTTFSVPVSSLTWLRTAHPKIKILPALNPDHEIDTDGYMSFNCAEQFMMYAKALYFYDLPSSSQIMATPDPKEQKSLGRAIANYDDALWLTVCERVAFEGNWWKFSGEQNKGYRDVLLGTRDRELCEASTKDRRWGIGYREKDALNYRRNWGSNLLGKALMRVRKRLRQRIGEIEVEWTRKDWDLPEEWI